MGSNRCSDFGNAAFYGFTTQHCVPHRPKEWFLLRKVIELLQDADGEVVGRTLSVLSKMLLAKDIPIASPTALQLAEMLCPLFDNVRLCACPPPLPSSGCCQETLCPVDFQTRAQLGLEQLVLRSCPLPFHQESSYVQLLSIHLFQDVMEFVAEVGKKLLKTHVHQSLLPLLCHLHDENQHVAEVRLSDLLGSCGRWLSCLLPWCLGDCSAPASSWPWLQSSSSGGPLFCCCGSTRCPR